MKNGFSLSDNKCHVSFRSYPCCPTRRLVLNGGASVPLARPVRIRPQPLLDSDWVLLRQRLLRRTRSGRWREWVRLRSCWKRRKKTMSHLGSRSGQERAESRDEERRPRWNWGQTSGMSRWGTPIKKTNLPALIEQETFLLFYFAIRSFSVTLQQSESEKLSQVEKGKHSYRFFRFFFFSLSPSYLALHTAPGFWLDDGISRPSGCCC